jgi:hypothetical protein
VTLAIRVSDIPKDITGMGLRVGGALKTVTEGWIRVDGALKQFYALIQIALSSYSVLGRGNSATSVLVTSATVTASVVGAVGAVTYAWTRTDSDPQAWTINNPTAASASFSTLCDQGDQFTATFHCTTTDAAGQVIVSSDVTADCANIYYGGGYPGSGGTPGSVYP